MIYSPKDFVIGLTMFNRPDMLFKTIKSIKRLNMEHPILIYDDCSTEIDYSKILKEIPRASIFRGENNSGRADFSMALLMDLFLNTNSKYLILVDSDLIVDEEISEFVC